MAGFEDGGWGLDIRNRGNLQTLKKTRKQILETPEERVFRSTYKGHMDKIKGGGSKGGRWGWLWLGAVGR